MATWVRWERNYLFQGNNKKTPTKPKTSSAPERVKMDGGAGKTDWPKAGPGTITDIEGGGGGLKQIGGPSIVGGLRKGGADVKEGQRTSP